MSKLNKMIVVVISAFFMLISMTACNSTKEEKPAKETIVVKAKEEKVKEKIEPTLAEQGFSFDGLEIDPTEGIVLMKLKGPKGSYYGLMNSDFEWILKPTNEIVMFSDSANDSANEVYFSEGLIRAAVKEEREIRANRGGKKEQYKWGYLNTKGEWVIEPIYRDVSGFSDGVAIVTTIEEDRDDLSNARQIVINQTGKELFELVSTYSIADSPEEDYEGYNFENGYLKTEEGLYDTSGKLHVIDFVPESEDEWGSYKVVDNKILILEGMNVAVYELSGHLLKKIPLNDEFTDEPYNLFTTEGLQNEKKFIVVGNDSEGNSFSVLLDLDGNKYGENIEPEADEDTKGQAEPYLFAYEEEGTLVYNFNGEKIGVMPSEAEGLYNDRYWVEGNEYDKLVTLDGQVVIDEDKKIKVNSLLEGPVIPASRRLNADDPEMTNVLLNTVTSKTITINEILNK
ncbi:WG repeat-containing protein [Mesobacillus subterraneus]|uniref:WG repeat-containing protein n=1 Tax=Mesobacillus subterraneus TaxID=285983 RepID=UPI001CFE0284|nr:WG repeat-containing protein [Mesobacillus subterraneus]